MRSIVALAALALSGSVQLASAARCRPSSTTGLATTAVSTSTASTSAPVVTNEIEGGRFAKKGPDGGLVDFEGSGDASHADKGNKGDGSKDNGCAQLNADSGVKRAVGPTAGISQTISLLNPNTPYTVRFFAAVVSYPEAENSCAIRAYVGQNVFYEEWLPTTGPTLAYAPATAQANVPPRPAVFSIQMECTGGNAAVIYVDSIFMSNQVTPDNIDDYTLDYGDDDDAGSPTTAVGTESSDAASTGTQLPETESQTVTGTERSQTENVETGTATGTETSQTEDAETGSATNTEASETGTATEAQSTTEAESTVTSQEASESTTASEESTTISSTTSAASSEPTVSRICANVGSNPDDGKGCNRRPLTAASGHYFEYIGNIEKEQCAARCLSETECGSFEYRYVNDCHKECRLYSTRLSDDSPTGPDSETAISANDRSCAWEIPCWQPPADNVCLNKFADTLLPSCVRRKATLKACAEPWLRLTVADCTPEESCAGLCATYTGCVSYSLSSDPDEQRNCLLYTDPAEDISEEDDASLQEFVDLSCFACNGKDMALTTFAQPMDDNTPKPDNTCDAPNNANFFLATPEAPPPATTLLTSTRAATTTEEAQFA